MPSFVEGLGHQVKGRSRVAMLAGGADHGHTVHQVGAQHLVLDLDLVEREEEGAAADEQPGANRLRTRMKETGCGKVGDVVPESASGPPRDCRSRYQPIDTLV